MRSPTCCNPAVPNADNAAWHLRRATWEIFTPLDPNDATRELLCGSAVASELRRRLTDNAACLAALHAARLAPRIDRGFIRAVLDHGGVTPPDSYFREREALCRLARHVASLAIAQHELGADGAAVETIRDLHAAALRLHAPDMPLQCQRAASWISMSALDALERLLPRLAVVVADTGPEGVTTAATADQLRALRDALLDERALCAGWRGSMFVERIVFTNDWSARPQTAAWLPNKSGLANESAWRRIPGTWLLAPAQCTGAVRLLDYTSDCAAALEAQPSIDFARLAGERLFNCRSAVDCFAFPLLPIAPWYYDYGKPMAGN